MSRLKVFESIKDIEAFFTQKPEKTSELIPQIAGKLHKGEYFIKPWMVHGKHIEIIDEGFLSDDHVAVQGYPELAGAEGYIEVPDTDGLVTALPGVALVTTHGDCLPVYAYDPIKKVAGVAHAGWKGTMIGIAAELVKTMMDHYGCKAEDILTYIGPGIDKCCFEVRDDVRSQFLKEQPWMKEYIKQKDSEHYLIDLKGINERYLSLQGITHIDISPDCTCCMEDRYWSYRRCSDKNRMLAYIKIET